MQLSIKIEDNHLQEQITQYISNKQKQTNELIVEALKYFFQNKQKELLNYKTQNPEQSATTINFNLEVKQDYKLFQEVKDVKNYANKLRDDAWK
jgi:hypothetical protein